MLLVNFTRLTSHASPSSVDHHMATDTAGAAIAAPTTRSEQQSIVNVARL